MSGITFDAGGLIALDHDDRRVIALLARAAERGQRVTIPATALAQAIRNPARQARLARLIRQVTTDLVHLDGPDATTTGLLLASSRTTDIVDAHVVICARRAEQVVITSDADDLRQLDPSLPIIAVQGATLVQADGHVTFASHAVRQAGRIGLSSRAKTPRGRRRPAQ